ncbi:MAG TPA: toxin-antitoxin system HicB family antitoxin [Blastocatellia bacterium]|nr:toxin-antitoxin system HicB family antitoxin [Blastocatellia bacterium]
MKKKTVAARKKRISRSSATAGQYLYTVGWSEDDEAYVARVAEFPSLAAHGDSQEAALRSLQQVVKAVLRDMTRSREPIPQPLGKRSFSGRLNVRMPSYLHRYLTIEAAQQSVSLNQLINLKLEAPLEMAVTSE